MGANIIILLFLSKENTFFISH